MKKKLVFCATLALGLQALSTPAFAGDMPKKFGLVLSGGYGTMSGGDISKVFEGMNELLRDVAARGGFTVTDTLKTASRGPQIEAELLFRPFPNIGLSIGAGWFGKSEETRGAAELGSSAGFSVDWNTDYSVIPVRLSIIYFLPAGVNLNAYFKAGAGYYFGRLKYAARVEEKLMGTNDWEMNEGTATGGGFGLHGGLGLEYSISPAFSVFLEAEGRHVRMSDLTASQTHSHPTSSIFQTGTFWYGERFQADFGKSYAAFLFYEDMPDEPGLSNIRKMVVGFSGFALKTGFKICF